MDEAPVDAGRVERARAGDPSAFEALVEPRVERMARMAMAVLGSEAEARDAVQDALLTAGASWPPSATRRPSRPG